MTDEALAAVLKTTPIFARIRPNQILRIVKLLKKGEIVAMTGDGVNDAQSIKLPILALPWLGAAQMWRARLIVLLDDDVGSIE